MATLKFYTVSDKYVAYIKQFESHVYDNLKGNSANYHTYVGILLCIEGMNYFAPLVSMKPKYANAKDRIDMILLPPYSVINLNNMMPVPKSEVAVLDFSKQKEDYRNLLQKEWRLCLAKQNKIIKNAQRLYGEITRGKIQMRHCFDFKMLEEKCRDFQVTP